MSAVVTHEERLALVMAAHADGRLSHTRQGDGCWRDLIWVYARKPESPTGVDLLCALDDTAENVALLRSLFAGYAPLSPMEGR